MMRRSRRGSIAALALVALALATGRVGAICVGDCDGDGAVVISELVTGVRVATGVADVTACPDFDVNADDEVTIDELVRGVRAATAGCPPRGGVGQVDTTPPTVTSAVALGATTVRIAFSEPLLRTAEDAAAEDARNYRLTPSVSGLAGAVVTEARLNAAKTQVLLTTLPLVAGVEYRVGVTRVKDEAGNPLKTDALVSFVFAGEPGGALPRVVGAASLGNTAVVVQFSAPMADNVIDPKNYRIVQPNVNPEVGRLEVTAAEFSAAGNRLSVRLTTRSQNELTYALTALAVTDLAGNPLAPQITVGGATIDPATATFPGTGPSCLAIACTNGGAGVDGAGACATDADCALYPPCSADAEHWRLFGLDLESIDALVVDPSDPKTLYAAGNGAGTVFKSSDGGRTWAENTTGMTGIVGLVIDPAAPVTVYAAGTKGVVASIDGGATWTPANGNLPADLTIATLVIDARTPSTLYVGGTMHGRLLNQGVIFRSSDRGATWGNPIYPGNRETVSAIAFDPHDRVVIYAGDQTGVHKTVNGGITWPEATLTNAAVTTIVVDPRAPATLYAGTESSGVFKSVDGAANWTQSAGLGAGTLVGALAIDRSDSHTLYAAGSSDCTATGCTNHRYESTDGGSTWIPIDGGLPAALARGFVAAIDGAVFTSPGAGLFAIVACPENACASRCELRDSDGDGVADYEEQRGWVVVVTQADGQTVEREVTSRTDRADSDGDGLSDLEEEQLRTDPNTTDTDADGIDDATEWNVLYSDPRAPDSDGDGLLDGTEVQFTKTSPILADTDGDGLSDGDELFAFNRNPLIADVPDVMVTVGDVRLQIEETFSYTDEQGDTVSDETTTATTLSRDESGSFVKSHERHETNLDEFAAGVEFGLNGLGTIVNNSCDTGLDFKGYCVGGLNLLAHIERTQTSDNGDLWVTDNESAHESENAFETTADRVREHATTSAVTREVTGARIDVDLTIANTNDIAFTVRDLEITVLQRNPLDTNGFIPVATLVSNKALVSGEPLAVTLGPLKKQAGPFLFTSRDVFATLVQELMRAPQGLVFKVANYDLTDEFGRSFTFTGQTVHDRTVQIVIDRGDMGAERAFAATSTAQDDGYLAGGGLLGGFGDKGRATGLPLDYVLQGILGLKKFRPAAIVAGADGTADTTVQAGTDDVQVIVRGTTGLGFHSVVIDPGPNGTIDTPVPPGDELEQTEPDGIVAGLNQTADSYAVGDDVQLIPPGTTGLSVGSIVVGAGANGTIESTASKLDKLEYVTGYETSRTCDQLSKNAFKPCRLDIECTASGQGGGICAPPERLVRVGSLRNGDFNRAWFVLATGDLPTAANFGDLRAHAGEDLKLAFLQDLDHDGLFAQEEFLAGSLDSAVDRFDNSTFGVDFDLDEALKHVPPPGMPADGIPDSQDTDFDGLGDYAEVKVGWKVSTEAGLMQVFSSPRSRDSDGDGLLDPEEADLRNFCAPVTKKCTAGMSIDAVCSADADCPGSVVLGRCATMNDPRMDGLCAFQSNPVTQNEASAIIAGKNGTADTAVPKQGNPGYDPNNDDEPLVPAGIENLPYDTPVIGPGKNGVLDTALGGDDQYTSARFVPPATDPSRRDTDDDGVTDGDELLGFDVGLAIVDGGNGIAETAKQGDDLQRTQFQQPVVAGGIVLLPGPNGRIDSSAVGDDRIHPAQMVVTDPLRRDTDSDTIADGVERDQGSDPTVPDGTDFRDADEDGMFDAEETDLGWDVSVDNGNPVHVKSSPYAADTDGDGLPDLIERYLRTNPNRADTDGDGITDFDEVADFPTYIRLSAPYRGVVINGSASARYGTDPRKSDTDGDGLTDYEEVSGYAFVNSAGVTSVVVTDPRRPDTDGDGLNDKAERDHIMVNGRTAPTDATNPDTDGDGKLDGADGDPLTPEHRVTVVFTALNAEKLIDHDLSNPVTDDLAALGWWFLVTDPAGVEHLVSAADSSGLTLGGVYDACKFAIYASGLSIHLDIGSSASFTVAAGQSFTVHGLWADLSTIPTGQPGAGTVDPASMDPSCGKPPYFTPRTFQSSCYHNFAYHYDYSDIADPTRQVIRVDTTKTDATTTRTMGGCEATMHFEIHID